MTASGFHFREARRENVPLLLGLAGGTGSGKTWSAMALATGLANGRRFAVIDTENGRAKHYADQFHFDVADLEAPFRPDRYADAIQAADAADYPVVVVDSMSHEWAGDGGLLDWQEEEYQRLGARDAVKMTSWIKPKMAHRKMVTRLLQVRAHVILCFRAAEKVEMRRGEDGKMQVVPKTTLTGLDGWVPITEKDLPYELTVSFLLTADRPGVPRPIKLQEQHRAFVALDATLDEAAGQRMREWAAGAAGPAAASGDAAAAITETDRRDLFAKAREHDGGTDRLKTIVRDVTGKDSTAGMTVAQYQQVLAKVSEPESATAAAETEGAPDAAASSGSADEAGGEGDAVPSPDQPAGETLFQAPEIRPDRETGE